MKRIFLVLISSILLISSCTTSANENNSVESKSSIPEINRDFDFMSDLVEALRLNGVDCRNYVQNPDTLFVKEEGTCTYNGIELTLILWGGDQETTRQMVDSLKAFGGYWLMSNNWVIIVQNESVAKELTTKLDLEVL